MKKVSFNCEQSANSTGIFSVLYMYTNNMTGSHENYSEPGSPVFISFSGLHSTCGSARNQQPRRSSLPHLNRSPGRRRDPPPEISCRHGPRLPLSVRRPSVLCFRAERSCRNLRSRYRWAGIRHQRACRRWHSGSASHPDLFPEDFSACRDA